MANFCDNCGMSLEPGMKFCNQCGARQGQVDAVAAAPAPVAPAHQSAPKMPTAPTTGVTGGQHMPPPRPKAAGMTMALYDQDYDQAPPAGQQQPQSQQSFAPKSQQEVFAPRPQAVYPPPAYPSQSAVPAQTGGSKTDSLPVTICWLLLTGIPALGLIPAILWSIKPDAGYRGVLSNAMIVINVISTTVLIIILYQFYSVLTQVADVNINWFWQ